MAALTQERLKEVLDYDQETGLFTWKVRTSNCVKVGQEAGTIDGKGYPRIQIDTKIHRAHRLAFLYMTGCWPENAVDHIDGDRADNRWANLRRATRFENGRNRKRQSTNTSGFKGISRNGKGWMARIRLDGKNSYLGTFDTPGEAHQAYCTAARKHFGEFARFE